jgi:hypothetical protein
MTDAPADVLVAGYQDIGAARRDFDAVVGLVRKRLRVEGPFTGTVKTAIFDLKPTVHEHEKTLHETVHHDVVVSCLKRVAR